MDGVWKSSRLWLNVTVFTMAGYSCRLYQAPVLAKHAMAIFSPTAAKQRWSCKTDNHLSAQVQLESSPPQHISPKCKHNMQTL